MVRWMESNNLRRIVYLVNFTIIVLVSSFFHEPKLSEEVSHVSGLVGLVLIVMGAINAFYVHRLFPINHERLEDFPNLLEDGPYRYVRHPFYSSLILISFGIPLLCKSIPGLAAAIFLIILWEKLADIEKRELLERWGEGIGSL